MIPSNFPTTSSFSTNTSNIEEQPSSRKRNRTERDSVQDIATPLFTDTSSTEASSSTSSSSTDSMQGFSIKRQRSRLPRQILHHRFNVNHNLAPQQAALPRIPNRSTSSSKPPSVYTKYTQEGEEQGKVVKIGEKEYAVEKLGLGVYHVVYAFTGNDTLCINGETVQLNTTIFKEFNPLKITGFRAKQSTMSEDVEAYHRLSREGVPMPKVYVMPGQFDEGSYPNFGNTWIIEKMDQKIEDFSDDTVLGFVKSWLTKSAEENREIINDFFPRNVMMKNGSCYIVDPSPLCDTEEWIDNLYSYVKAWSNGSEETYNFLVENFPEDIKATLANFLVEEKQGKGGQFPVSDQTNA